MNAIEQAIHNALATQGDSVNANKAYLEFIKGNFIIPIEKESANEEPKVLFFQNSSQTFLPVFSSMTYFDQWALPIKDEISLLKLSGVDLLTGIGDDVVVSFNIGSDLYKEFNAAELARMRSMVIKLFGSH
jgi:hypothetical protein